MNVRSSFRPCTATRHCRRSVCLLSDSDGCVVVILLQKFVSSIVAVARIPCDIAIFVFDDYFC